MVESSNLEKANVKRHSGPRKRRPKKKAIQSNSPEFPSSTVNITLPLNDTNEQETRSYWTNYVIEAAEKERMRRLAHLEALERDEELEIARRRAWALSAIATEQVERSRELFLDRLKNTQWFQSTIATKFPDDYEVVCPHSWVGCTVSCMLRDLETHLRVCAYRQVPDQLDQTSPLELDFNAYDVVCPNAVRGCPVICSREKLTLHLANCPVNGISREKERQEREEDQALVIQMSEQERMRRMSDDLWNRKKMVLSQVQRLYQAQTTLFQHVLHDEISNFAMESTNSNVVKKQWIETRIVEIENVIKKIWPKALVKTYGSFACGLHGKTSDVDLVVFGVVNEEVLAKDCVALLANQLQGLPLQGNTNVENASLKSCDVIAITTATIPLVKFTVHDGSFRIPFDITFDESASIHHGFGQRPGHFGVASAVLVDELCKNFVGLRELVLVLKHFIATRGLNDPYLGGISSYALVLMIVAVLKVHGGLVSYVESVEDSNKPRRTANLEVIMNQSDSEIEWAAQCAIGRKVAGEILAECTTTQIIDPHATGSDTIGKKQYILGKLLMEFLHFYGDDFQPQVDQIRLLPLRVGDTQEESACMERLPGEGIGFLTICDPLQPLNNVGKSCYRGSQVLREFSEFLNFLSGLIVRGAGLGLGVGVVHQLKPTSVIRNTNELKENLHNNSGYPILQSIFDQLGKSPTN